MVSDLLSKFSCHHKLFERIESTLHVDVSYSELAEERGAHLPELPVHLVYPDVKKKLSSDTGSMTGIIDIQICYHSRRQ